MRKKYYTQREIIALLDCSEWSVRKWKEELEKAGLLITSPEGRATAYSEKAVEFIREKNELKNTKERTGRKKVHAIRSLISTHARTLVKRLNEFFPAGDFAGKLPACVRYRGGKWEIEPNKKPDISGV